MSVEKAKLNVTPWTLNELKAWALESESDILLDPATTRQKKGFLDHKTLKISTTVPRVCVVGGGTL